MKKSSQERLALKILIDRPKARNEVRQNTVVVLINACCFLSLAVSVCFVPSSCLLLIHVFPFLSILCLFCVCGWADLPATFGFLWHLPASPGH